jgi:hypothetical protein
MPRNNTDFHNQILYHGSDRSFSIGDTVVPHENEKLGLDKASYAYATNVPVYASTYGKNVYQVEPVDPEDVERSKVVGYVGKGKAPAHHYTSKKGFKVVGEHDGT